MSRLYRTKDAQIHQLQREVENRKNDNAGLVEKCKALLSESLRYKQRCDEIEKPTDSGNRWYMVSWRSSRGFYGSTELSLNHVWQVGDMAKAVDFLKGLNNHAGDISIVSVLAVSKDKES